MTKVQQGCGMPQLSQHQTLAGYSPRLNQPKAKAKPRARPSTPPPSWHPCALQRTKSIARNFLSHRIKLSEQKRIRIAGSEAKGARKDKRTLPRLASKPKLRSRTVRSAWSLSYRLANSLQGARQNHSSATCRRLATTNLARKPKIVKETPVNPQPWWRTQ